MDEITTPSGGANMLDRIGLPQRYGFLLARLPRAVWPSSRLDPLAQHWLEVHQWYRGLLDALIGIGRAWTDRRLDDQDYHDAALPRLGHFLGHLELHHHIETTEHFPGMAAAEPRLRGAFELLDHDHALLDAILRELAASGRALHVSAIRGGRSGDPIRALVETLERLERPLLRHLSDEEDVIVPQLTIARFPPE